MIISHRHKYVFVQLPHAASTAIAGELCEKYDGVPILNQHSRYDEFLKTARRAERSYSVFSSIRNPLDEVVTVYFKYKMNHKGNFTNPKRWKKNGGHVTDASLKRFHFIQNEDADFPRFFERFYKVPYHNLSILAHDQFDFIIRFENLQEDFAKMLSLIGVEQERPLPVANKTDGKRESFLEYYTPEIREQAKKVFGPLMRKWDYDFPPEWGHHTVSWLSRMQFAFLGVVKASYWKYVK